MPKAKNAANDERKYLDLRERAYGFQQMGRRVGKVAFAGLMVGGAVFTAGLALPAMPVIATVAAVVYAGTFTVCGVRGALWLAEKATERQAGQAWDERCHRASVAHEVIEEALSESLKSGCPLNDAKLKAAFDSRMESRVPATAAISVTLQAHRRL